MCGTYIYIYIWNADGICKEQSWSMHGISMEYVWDMDGVWMEHAWKIGVGYDQNIME